MKTLLSLRMLLVLKLVSLMKTIVNYLKLCENQAELHKKQKTKNQSAILQRSHTRKKSRITHFYQPNREFS